MAKIVGALVGDKRFYEFADQPPEFLHGALGAFAQRGFEFRECHLDWVEVWRIGGADSELLRQQPRFLRASPRLCGSAACPCIPCPPLSPSSRAPAPPKP